MATLLDKSERQIQAGIADNSVKQTDGSLEGTICSPYTM